MVPESATGAATTDLATLRVELAEVRAQGYAVNWEETTEGVCAVAAAIRDTVGQPLAGLGIAAPISRMKDVAAIRALAPAVLRGAESVLERLPGPQ